jgi:hypothetical protein
MAIGASKPANDASESLMLENDIYATETRPLAIP